MTLSRPGAAPEARRGQQRTRASSRYPLTLLDPAPTWRGAALSGRSLDLLAVLADCADASADAIIGALWPRDAPAHPVRALHVVVSRTRVLVGEGVIERVGDGYRRSPRRTSMLATWPPGRHEPGPAPLRATGIGSWP